METIEQVKERLKLPETKTLTRFEIRGDGGSFSAEKYSKYYERIQMSQRHEIKQSEIYGLAQCHEHLEEIYKRNDEFIASTIKDGLLPAVSMRLQTYCIVKVTTIEATIEVIAPAE